MKYLSVLLFLVSTSLFSQISVKQAAVQRKQVKTNEIEQSILNPIEQSTTRKFINEAQFTRTNKDWTTEAILKSGIGEYVKFFPIEVIDLKTGTKIEALQLDMFVKKPEVYKTAWVGKDEINEFINFIENNIIPNLELKHKNKSSEFVFKAKEMTLTYFVVGKNKKRITIKLNSYDGGEYKNYTFWTESQVDKISNLLQILKQIK